MAKNIKESTMNSFYSGDYKEFKDAINGEILNRVGDHIDQISSEIANELVYGSEDSDDETEDEESDEIKESKKDDDDDDQRGGEYLLDISFPDGQEGTALKNFRVSAISKSDALLRCEKMFGKGKFNVSSIKYYDFGDPINPAGAGKTGKAVKESFIDEIEAAFPVKKESPESEKKEKKVEKILKKLKTKKVDQETLTELKKETLANYIRKASNDARDKEFTAGLKSGMVDGDQEGAKKLIKKSSKRGHGIERALNKIVYNNTTSK